MQARNEISPFFSFEMKLWVEKIFLCSLGQAFRNLHEWAEFVVNFRAGFLKPVGDAESFFFF
jgi:hypothetical protein